MGAWRLAIKKVISYQSDIFKLIYTVMRKLYWYKEHRLAGIYLFNINNVNATMSGIYATLTIKTPKRYQWGHSGVFIVNFEQILYNVLEFPLLALNK